MKKIARLTSLLLVAVFLLAACGKKYADSGFLNKEDAKSKIDPISKDYNEVKGIKHKMNYQDDYFIEDIDSDFKNLDVKKAKNLHN